MIAKDVEFAHHNLALQSYFWDLRDHAQGRIFPALVFLLLASTHVLGKAAPYMENLTVAAAGTVSDARHDEIEDG